MQFIQYIVLVRVSDTITLHYITSGAKGQGEGQPILPYMKIHGRPKGVGSTHIFYITLHFMGDPELM